MNDFIGSAKQFGLHSTVIILIVLLPIGTLAIINMTKKLRRLNERIILKVEELLLALIDLNNTVLPDKK